MHGPGTSGGAQALGSRAAEEAGNLGAALEPRPTAKKEMPNNSPQEAAVPVTAVSSLLQTGRVPLQEAIPESRPPGQRACGGWEGPAGGRDWTPAGPDPWAPKEAGGHLPGL